MVREKYLENEFFFQVREKSGSFVNGQGNLERIGKVTEKSENLKIMAMAGSLQKIYLFFSRGEMIYLLLSHDQV